jgi:hypothetical protein
MQLAGAKRIFRRLTAASVLLLILAETAAGADSFGSDGVSAPAAASQFPMPAADIGSGLRDVTPTSDAALIDAAAVAVDRTSKSRHDAEASAGHDDENQTFMDQLVTQYFESYN